MKKIISLILSISMVITGLPMVVYAANSTPEISLEEFTEQLHDMQEEYDDNDYFSEITIKNDSEFYYIDGEENILTDSSGDVIEAVVSNDDFEIPLSAIDEYVDVPEVSTYSLDESDDITIDKETTEELGFEVNIQDDTATLTKPYQTNRLIVKSKYDINLLDSVDIVEGYNDLHIVQFDDEESTQSALEYYENQKQIEYAEPDLVMSTMDIDYTVDESSVTSSSINYDNHLSWGSESIGIDDYIDYLGDVSELPEVVVGIIDTGVDIDHEFLKDRIIETGYNTSDSGTKSSEDDDNGHGSHVAGIIADNTTDNVKIKAFKCLNLNGSGALSDVALAVDAAVESGVNVINMSLGAKTTSSLMETSVNNAIKKGITVCVAAGNSGADASKYCPANIKDCITVAAIDAYDKFPYWTNHGSSVDIIAPGVSIYSTYKNNSYDTLSGTSMASPFVAAASAMVLCKNINESPQGVCDTLVSNGRDCSPPSRLSGIGALYIGTITEYNSERTSIPQFSVESGKYSDNIVVEITCDDEDSEIYYTIDGTRATQSSGTLYEEPLVIDKVTEVHAVAYAPNKLKSLQAYADYYITSLDDESNFEIDSDGIIIAYNGTNNYLTIPDTIAGVTVTGIGAKAFYRSDIVMIKFPDTLTYVGDHAFYFCRYLYSVNANNIEYIDTYAFARCTKLAEIDLTNAEVIKEYGCFDLKALNSFYNDKVTKIEAHTFQSGNYIINVDIPNVVEIGNSAFESCYRIEEFNAPNVETIGNSVFDYCSHIETIDLPKLTSMGTYSFSTTKSLKTLNIPNYYGELPSGTFDGSGIEYFNFDSITSVRNYAFRDSQIKTIVLNNAVSVGEKAFYGCRHLEYIYIPNVTEIGYQAFYETTNIKTIFAPKLETAESLLTYDGVTLYLSDKFATELNYDYNCTIVAPSGSYAETWANDNEYTFVASDSIANALGRSICTSVAGLRFSFSWDNISDIENLATDIEYGFIYSQKGIEDLSIDTVGTNGIKKKVATNKVTNENNTTFNLVFANIPNSYLNTNITARAYVCIDGMYFYSDVKTGSFSEVANLVLNDKSIDQNTKDKIQNLLNA
jgi:subtilisin family serine protease